MSGLMILAMAYAVFAIYVLSLEPKAPDIETDAVVVLTGGAGRVQTGFRLIYEGKAKALLITGVHSDVKLDDLLTGLDGGIRRSVLRHCCVSLGYSAESTEDNALEAAEWVSAQNLPKGAKIRVVTSDFHMPRALLQFHKMLPDATLYEWPVKSRSQDRAFWRNVTTEFGKYIMGLLSYTRKPDDA